MPREAPVTTAVRPGSRSAPFVLDMIDPVHEVDVDVQIAKVDAVDDLTLYDAPERSEVDHVGGARIDGTFDGHLERVRYSRDA
jgi:hypothetical protein